MQAFRRTRKHYETEVTDHEQRRQGSTRNKTERKSSTWNVRSRPGVENVRKALDFKIARAGLGECYHDQSCRFVRPPMSNSARTLRPCGDCMQAAVRGVLNQA